MPPFESIENDDLHFAAMDGDIDRVTALLAAGVDPNRFDGLGKTPLHYAAERAHLGVMRLLLENGAHVDAHDEAMIGNTPLAQVAGDCSLEVARILVEAGADPTIPGWMQLSALDRSVTRKRGEGPSVHALLENAARTGRRR